MCLLSSNTASGSMTVKQYRMYTSVCLPFIVIIHVHITYGYIVYNVYIYTPLPGQPPGYNCNKKPFWGYNCNKKLYTAQGRLNPDITALNFAWLWEGPQSIEKENTSLHHAAINARKPTTYSAP